MDNLKRSFLLGSAIALGVCAQDPPDLVAARAIDQEISKLHDAACDPLATKALAARIRQQPAKYAVPLAENLAIDSTEACDQDTLQQVADTLADALKRSPAREGDGAYHQLASLAFFDHVQVSLVDKGYSSAIAKLRDDEQRRKSADFSLADVAGRKWNLRGLRGKVVLVNFWQTWCPPCRREMPDLAELYKRFAVQGLVILAITDEDVSVVKPFVESKVDYPVLLDPGKKVQTLFRIDGFPADFVYGRQGKLVATSMERPSMARLLDMLKQAGLE